MSVVTETIRCADVFVAEQTLANRGFMRTSGASRKESMWMRGQQWARIERMPASGKAVIQIGLSTV